MITFHIFTIFPESFRSYFDTSILKRAQKKNIVKIKIYNIRDFAKDKHKTTDDRPYGGGPGMVLKIKPIVRAIKGLKNFKFILLSPGGKQFTQSMARSFAKREKNIALICGHYEGIDARLKKTLKDMKIKTEEISIGPYILSGGEIAAMAIVDTISRHIPGVLGKTESLEENKGSYPVYTRPEIFDFKGKKYRVPKVLLSGDHKKISAWRLKYNKMNW